MSPIIELFSDADDEFFERIMTNFEHVLHVLRATTVLTWETWSLIQPQRTYSQSIIDNKNYWYYWARQFN